VKKAGVRLQSCRRRNCKGPPRVSVQDKGARAWITTSAVERLPVPLAVANPLFKSQDRQQSADRKILTDVRRAAPWCLDTATISARHRRTATWASLWIPAMTGLRVDSAQISIMSWRRSRGSSIRRLRSIISIAARMSSEAARLMKSRASFA
jgi:hypothetical protein